MIVMGIRLVGCFHPIKIAYGNNNKNEIMIPFKIPFILIPLVEIINPDTIHIENADKLASQVSFCKNMGITSNTPAAAPKTNPTMIFFVIFPSTVLFWGLIFGKRLLN
jgi:hypothetical protein